KIGFARHDNVDVAGAGIPIWDIEPIRGHLEYSLLSGHVPGTGEAAIGPSSAKALHVHDGDHVHVGGAHPADLLVVGTALLPETPHSSCDQGLWGSATTMRALFGPATTSNSDDSFVVTRRAGITQDRLFAALDKNVSHDIDTVTLPQDVVFLHNVRSLP